MSARDDESAALTRLLEGEQLTSVMNDTRWEELLAAMRAFHPPAIEWQAKDVRGAGPGPWDTELYYHLRPFRTVEWVDLRIVPWTAPAWHARRLSAGELAAAEARLRATLLALRIPFSIEGGVVRIWGYTRPGAQPAWVTAPAT